MSRALVSLLIISYNQRSFIREALESAVNQDYADLEVIAADDGSTDGTAEIIREYAEAYPGRVVPVIGDRNLGVTGNSNRGLARCRGEYLALQGGDDVLLPGKISRQVAWLAGDPRRVLCYHDMDVFDSESGKTLYFQSQRYRFFSGGAGTLVLHGTYFGATTAMVRYPRDLGIVFEPTIPVASDWMFWIDVVEAQQGIIGYVDGVYARYRQHGGNVTAAGHHGLVDNVRTLEIVDQRYPRYRDFCRRRRSLLYLVEAKRAFIAGRYPLSARYAANALLECRGNILVPLNLRNRI